MCGRTAYIQVIEVNWDHDPASVLDISDADDPLEVTFRSVKRPTTACKEAYERV